jgi:hypothetical protein
MEGHRGTDWDQEKQRLLAEKKQWLAREQQLLAQIRELRDPRT